MRVNPVTFSYGVLTAADKFLCSVVQTVHVTNGDRWTVMHAVIETFLFSPELKSGDQGPCPRSKGQSFSCRFLFGNPDF